MRIPLAVTNFNRLLTDLAPLENGFDLLNDHVVITDENANIIYANRAVEKNTGFPLNEIIGKNPADLWGGNMPKDFYEKMWYTIKTEKKPFVAEVQNKRKDSTLYWQELHISPVLDENGKVKFFIGIEPNITDRKEKEKFRDEFIGIVGHQIRNPLASIKWMIEWLSKSGNLTEEAKIKLEELHKETLSLSDFVADLLIISRIEGSGLVKEKVDLGIEIDKTINEVKRLNSKVDFTFKKIGSDFITHVSQSMMSQVFSNLIYNAAEYSFGKVDITLERKDSEYLFSCHNNGPEISETDKPKIFFRLFRSEVARKIKKKDTGLGLYIVKAIVDNFGWKIRFESGVGQGTTFYVAIPLAG